MERVTISELKNRLSAFLKKVRAGQSIIIMDRNQPVARIERLGAAGRSDERLSRLEKSGILRTASRRISVKALRASAPSSRESVVQALLDERRESR